jgi:hypothetical protein
MRLSLVYKLVGTSAVALWLLVGCSGGEQEGEEEPTSGTPTEQATGASTQPAADASAGKHEDLEMGQAADWQSGFHLRLSDPHLGTETQTPKQQRAGEPGTPAVVMQMEIWNDGQSPVLLKSTPCAARDPDGLPLMETHLVPEVGSGGSIFGRPLEPGQQRSKAVAYVLPQSGSTLTLKCSPVYATGQLNIMSGREPPREATATYNLDVSNLP